MLGLTLNNLSNPLSILVIGAHCDDIEIGCGGTILSIVEGNPDVHITWVILSSTENRKTEAIKSANLYCADATEFDLKILDFKDGFLPYIGESLKNTFEHLKGEIDPDIIFTHYRHDLHQDHRLVSELTWNTFRNHLILEYEIPKWDGDLGTPNTFFHLDEATGRKKLKYLQQIYESQKTKAWFTDDLFWALMRIRGMESNSPSGIAEAFYFRKCVLKI